LYQSVDLVICQFANCPPRSPPERRGQAAKATGYLWIIRAINFAKGASRTGKALAKCSDAC